MGVGSPKSAGGRDDARGRLSRLVGGPPKTSGKVRLAVCAAAGVALIFLVPVADEPVLFELFAACMALMGGLQALGDLLYRKSRVVGELLRLAGFAAAVVGFPCSPFSSGGRASGAGSPGRWWSTPGALPGSWCGRSARGSGTGADGSSREGDAMDGEHDASEEALGGKIGELGAEVDGLGELVEGMGETPNVGMGSRDRRRRVRGRPAGTEEDLTPAWGVSAPRQPGKIRCWRCGAQGRILANYTDEIACGDHDTNDPSAQDKDATQSGDG